MDLLLVLASSCCSSSGGDSFESGQMDEILYWRFVQHERYEEVQRRRRLYSTLVAKAMVTYMR